MLNRFRLMLIGLLAALIVASTVAGASANRLSLTGGGGYYVLWKRLEFRTDSGTIACEVDMTGTFHTRTINKTRGALIGNVINVRVPMGCIRGSLVALTETLPWHITYSSFAGTLPRISAINWAVSGLRFRYTTGGVSCLFTTETTEPFITSGVVDTTNGVIDELRPDETAEIDLEDPDFACDFRGDSVFLGSKGIITEPPIEPAAISFRLI